MLCSSSDAPSCYMSYHSQNDPNTSYCQIVYSISEITVKGLVQACKRLKESETTVNFPTGHPQCLLDGCYLSRVHGGCPREIE
ncbi:hypothetical protein J6590_045130 [Homalodisca vitripennis]|nr:hypothetical protein J6590_045130 [Homalodisca vitripennis]